MRSFRVTVERCKLHSFIKATRNFTFIDNIKGVGNYSA
jgi:hypothetical protein